MQQIKTLIPLSEFVQKALEYRDREYRALKPDLNIYCLRLIENYQKFPQQPLNLWQFVPVGEDDNVLEEPKWSTSLNERDYMRKMEAYNKAKERCLFEGWQIKGIDEGLWELENTTQDVWITFVGKDVEIINFDGYEESIETIEQMFEYCKNKGFVLALTPTALKQIY